MPRRGYRYSPPPMMIGDWLGLGSPGEILGAGGVVLLVLALLVIRFIQKLVLRLVLVGLLVVVGIGIYVNRAELAECTRTCSCQVADRQVDVPFCSDKLRRERT